jgi:hypothetical protein
VRPSAAPRAYANEYGQNRRSLENSALTSLFDRRIGQQTTGKGMAEEETPKSIRGRPFAPGNPGRPPGSKNQATRLVEQLMADDAETLIRKLIELALEGNVKCIQLCLDRISPKRNGRPIDFQLPPISNARDIVVAMAAITTAVNDGTLTAEEADHLAHLIQSYAKAVETHDLSARLEAIEAQMKKGNS